MTGVRQLIYIVLLLVAGNCASYDHGRGDTQGNDKVLPEKVSGWRLASYEPFQSQKISPEIIGMYVNGAVSLEISKDQGKVNIPGSPSISCHLFFYRAEKAYRRKNDMSSVALRNEQAKEKKPSQEIVPEITDSFPNGNEEGGYYDQILLAEKKSSGKPGKECARVLRISKHGLAFEALNNVQKALSGIKDIQSFSDGWYLFSANPDMFFPDFKETLETHVKMLQSERVTPGEVQEYRLGKEQTIMLYHKLLSVTVNNGQSPRSKFGQWVREKFFIIRRLEIKDSDKQTEYDQALDLYAHFLESKL